LGCWAAGGGTSRVAVAILTADGGRGTKGTTLGYPAEENRLRVQGTQDDIDRMVTYPAPTYVVGIDVNAIGVGFLLSMPA